jgi:hypothetical protein
MMIGALHMQRVLFIAGAVLLLTAFLWPWASRIPLGRLPGDLLIDRPGLKVYVPITTMIVVSIVVSAILWLFRR